MMNKYRISRSSVQFLLLLVVSLCLWLPMQTAAAEMPVSEIAKKLQESYNKITSLQASFVQETYSKLSSRKRTGNGSLVLVKPGLMRWDYQAPDVQVFICDGERLSMYFAKENQMFTSSAKQYLESDVMYSFFAGSANISRDFDVLESTETEQDIDETTFQMRLIPKTMHPQIDEITVWVDRSSYLLSRLKVVDKFGSITDMIFSDIVENQKVDRSRFAFTPPAGTEIINQ
nr:outer membrane lipoprotein chaperone LolA [Desulfobulbaceae bacterium]